jgi:poly(A) polymerase
MTQEEKILDLVKRTIKGTEWENKIYLVGGAVRDQVMGGVVDDLDFVVEGNITSGVDFAEWLCKKWNVFKPNSNPVIFPKYGTANMHYNDIKLEFVAPRKEKYTEGSRKPVVSDGVLMDDAMRRDLTINSLMRNISTNQIVDLTGKGMYDIKNGIIRTPSDPEIIFKDDPLRMLRAIRFTVKYGFKMSQETMDGITMHANLINSGAVSQERIGTELSKILLSKDPVMGIELMQKTGLLKIIIPELDQMVGLGQNKYHSEDAYHHTLSVLKNTPPKLETRLMALLHDIGKAATKSTAEGDEVHFYGHENVGEKIAIDILRRLKYPNELINAVALGVKTHMSLKHGLDDAAKISDKTLRKFSVSTGEHLNDILDLIHADNVSHSDVASMPNQIKYVKQRIDNLKTPKTQTDVKLPLDGNDIKQILGIKDGPMVGKVKTAVEDAWYENPNLTRDEAIEIVKQFKIENEINEIKRIMKAIIN